MVKRWMDTERKRVAKREREGEEDSNKERVGKIVRGEGTDRHAEREGGEGIDRHRERNGGEEINRREEREKAVKQ